LGALAAWAAGSAGQHAIEFPQALELELAGSEGEIDSALTNLLSNAVRYTPARGGISVRPQRLGDGRLENAVRDSGIGIAPAPAAAGRALLPRGRQPLARHRRHGVGAVHRQARGQQPGQGLHLQAAAAGGAGAAGAAHAVTLRRRLSGAEA
jgi:hypothetical protein